MDPRLASAHHHFPGLLVHTWLGWGGWWRLALCLHLFCSSGSLDLRCLFQNDIFLGLLLWSTLHSQLQTPLSFPVTNSMSAADSHWIMLPLKAAGQHWQAACYIKSGCLYGVNTILGMQ